MHAGMRVCGYSATDTYLLYAVMRVSVYPPCGVRTRVCGDACASAHLRIYTATYLHSYTATHLHIYTYARLRVCMLASLHGFVYEGSSRALRVGL